MGKAIDLIGERFGRLVALEQAEKTASGKKRWICVCDCGKMKIVQQCNLTNGHTKSCGCLRSEVTTARNEIHNQCYTRIYAIWENIKQRCFDAGCKNYERYGSRGITMCAEWREFDAFYKWAMANGYAENLSIDRIDNNGNYEPSNCRWVDKKAQANNRRGNRLITYCGKTQTLAQWAYELGIDYRKLWARLNQCGWPIEKAFKTP